MNTGVDQSAQGRFQHSSLENLAAAIVVTATFIAYAATLSLGFVFDDHVLIVTNDSIRSWRYFPGYFTSHIWSFRYPHLLANYYRPLFLTWLRVNDMLFGLHPWGWHLTSVLAHVGVTYLVFRLARRLTRDVWVAGVAGLLFGLHPVHAEAVADITSIQEPLSTLFILGALLTFCRSRESAHPGRWLTASLLLTAAALLSKESGMVAPVLIACYAGIYGADDSRKTDREELPFFSSLRSAITASIPYWLVVLAYLPARVRALKGFAHVVTPLPLATEIFTVPSVLLFYLRLMVWPFGLSCYYDTPYVSAPHWREFVIPTLILSLFAVALVACWRRPVSRGNKWESQAILFSAALMVITIIPVLNLRFLPEGEIAHDRYVYLPSVGFIILVSLLLRRVVVQVQRRRAGAASPPLTPPIGVTLAVLILATGMGYATARQSLYWSDDLTLNFRAHEIAPRNVYATTSLAAAVAQHGLEGPAMALYQQALAIQPNFWRANVNLGYLYYAHGNYAAASRYFGRACAADPTDGDQFLYLGMAQMELGRLPEAESAIRTAILVRPRGKDYHLGLGMVLKQAGKLQEAREEFVSALAEDPANQRARSLLEEVDSRLKARREASPKPKIKERRP